MSNKSVTQPYQVVTNASMASDVISIETDVKTQDNMGYEVVYTGSPVGDFYVQGSISGNHWENLDLGTPRPEAVGTPGSFMVNLNQLPYAKIRFFYDATSGSGILNVYAMVKRLGG